MYRRLLVATGLLLAVIGVALTAAGAYAYSWASGHEDVIAPGVTIAGIDVGGMRATTARTLVESTLQARLSRPVHLVDGSHSFTIHPANAGLRLDAAHMVDDAVAASRH